MKLEEALNLIKKDKNFRVRFVWSQDKREDFFPDKGEQPFSDYEQAKDNAIQFSQATKGVTEDFKIVCSKSGQQIGSWALKHNPANTQYR